MTATATAKPAPAKTALYDWHAAHHGRLVEFGGWLMPVQYETIVAEHNTVRKTVGLFDVSHMGRLKFTGAGAGTFLEGLLTRRVADMKPGQIRYSLVTNDAGGILDDVLLCNLTGDNKHSGSPYYLLVVNASNRQKILDWLAPRLHDRPDVQMADETLATAMIAVQGPAALKLLQPLADIDLAAMRYYTGAEAKIGGRPAIVSRTGYTGEDGFELTVPAAEAVAIWDSLLSAGKPLGAQPAGLGARDTLRLEAAMPLYGHELNEEIDPLTAGLGFAVHLDGRSFPGRDALARIAAAPTSRVRIGLQLSGKRVPREHYEIRKGQEPVGEVTSGTFSPTFQHPIAMGYVRSESAQEGAELMIDIRGQAEPARVVKLPFYRRAK